MVKPHPYSTVNAAFSKQADHYDIDDEVNPILQSWRQQVYAHVDNFISVNSHILELNPGTGIDAMRFIGKGHRVHGVELSNGMVSQIKRKIENFGLQNRFTIQQESFENLDRVAGTFDYVFSNFGGLNCTDDLKKVARHLPTLLNDGGFVTWVIMPPFCPWEISWALKGHFKQAFRRFHSDGVMAHLEGEYFKTYYYSLDDITKALGSKFKLQRCEGLGVLSPPPSATTFQKKYPRLFKTLQGMDSSIKDLFPFNRIGDHLIVTFRYHKQ